MVKEKRLHRANYWRPNPTTWLLLLTPVCRTSLATPGARHPIIRVDAFASLEVVLCVAIRDNLPKQAARWPHR